MNCCNRSAARVRRSTRMPTRPTSSAWPLRWVASSSRKLRVEKMSNTLGCSGTTSLSAIFSRSPMRQPLRPPGVSMTTCVVPRGGLAMKSLWMSQVPMGRTFSGRSDSHRREDCWRSASPSITACPWLAQ